MPRRKKVEQLPLLIVDESASNQIELSPVEELRAARAWGGARPGAGRPRVGSLDEAELTFLAWLLNASAYSEEHADLTEKLLRMADRVSVKGR